MRLTRNFSLQEFGAVPTEYHANVRALALMLEHVRALCGRRPITITSGWRLPRKTGDRSQHLTASAADFSVEGMSTLIVAHRVAAARARGDFPEFGQLICYPYERFHTHLSLANRFSGRTDEILVTVRKSPETYRPWDGWGPVPPNANPPLL